MKLFGLAASLIVCFCLACVGPSQSVADPQQPIEITIVSTGDFHGALEPRHAKVVGGRELGGMDIIASYFSALRAQNPGGLIFLDAGDLYQGTLLSAASEGKAVIEVYNDLGYDAATIGNHDFDFGPLGYHSIPETEGEDPHGVLKARMKQARFPFVSANIFDQASGKRPDWEDLFPYVLLKRKGVTVGVIGLSAFETPLVTHPANVRTLRFAPLLSTFRKVLPEVRRKGAQVVVILAHSGVEVDERTGRAKGPIAELAQALKPGEADLIISGHTHLPFSGKINGIPVVQSWPNGMSFSRVDLSLDPVSGKVLTDQTVVHENTFYYRKTRDGGPLTFLGQPITPDPAYVANLKKHRRSIAHLQQINLGHSRRDLANKAELDSPVGNLVTDAMRASDPQIEIAMYNSGGLRTSIPKGTVTFGRIYEVVPFDNFLVKVTLSGAQILEVLEHGLSAPYGVMEISGLKVDIDRSAPPGKRCRTVQTDDGKPLDCQRLYVVGTNEFVLNGGDGYNTFSGGRDVHNTHALIRELVARYIKNQGIVEPEMGGRYRPTGTSGGKTDL